MAPPRRRSVVGPAALAVAALALAASSSAPLASAHRSKKSKGGGGGTSSTCTNLSKSCGFLNSAGFTTELDAALQWQKKAATFVLNTDDSGAVSCAPQDTDGLSNCQYVNERSELLMDVSCPGGKDYAIFQVATGQLVDIQPDGSATFDPWVPGITQSVLDFTAYATVGGAVGPPAGQQLYWSVEIMCQPQFYPEGYPSAAGAHSAAGSSGRVARVAVAAPSAAKASAAAKAALAAKAGKGSG